MPEHSQSTAEIRVAGFACVGCHAEGAESDGGSPRVPDGATGSDAAELTRTDRRADRLELIASAALALEKAAGVLSREALLEEWYSLDIRDGIDLYQEVRRFETYLIKRALREAGGSQSKAARLLGLNKTTLYEKIKRYEIDYTKARRPIDRRENQSGHQAFDDGGA